MHLTRRALLLATGGVALVACRPKSTRPARPPVTDRAALDEALTAEEALVAGYDAAIARLDGTATVPLVRARDRHALHVTALAAARRLPPATSPGSPSASAAAGDLHAALQQSIRSLQAAAAAAVDGAAAALLASIAAEHAADAAHGTNG